MLTPQLPPLLTAPCNFLYLSTYHIILELFACLSHQIVSSLRAIFVTLDPSIGLGTYQILNKCLG